MKMKEIRNANDALFEKAYALYEISFPEIERRDREDNIGLLQRKDFRFSALLTDEGDFCGLAAYWDNGEFLYIEHLCTEPALRGRGLGAEALELFKNTSKEVLLEIDPPKDALSERRKAFYERCGFSYFDEVHMHPAYREGDPPHPLNVMAYPGRPDGKTVRKLASYIEKEVFGRK